MSPSESEPADSTPSPKKPRQMVNRLTKDTSEKDLWDFDPDEVEAPPSVESAPEEADAAGIPKPRYKAPKAVERAPRPLPASTFEDGEPMIRQSAIRQRSQTGGPMRTQKPNDDIGELEDTGDVWEEPTLPSPVEIEPAPPEPDQTVPIPDEQPLPVIEPEPAPQETSAPQLSKRTLRDGLKFSKVEKIGLIVLAAALSLTAIFLLSSTLRHMPTRSDSEERPDFPIQGTQLRVISAGSYWREPVLSGPRAEAVRRETKLIPVVELKLEGGPCAIRAIFRNDQGESVGDSVTRSASTGVLEIAATAGFEDLGAHAAYRTGETKPWKIEIFEAPSVDSTRQEFKKLLEIPISNERR